jgi:hypothetical protein
MEYYKRIMLMVADGNEKAVPELGKQLKNRVKIADVQGYNLEKVKEAIEYGVRCHGVGLVIFDNVTSYCIGKSDFQEAARSLYGLFVELGKRLGHHTISVSHTRRDAGLKAGTAPSMSAAFGSSGVEQFSDTVIALGREEGSHETWFAIRKQRFNGDVGEGSKPLKWDTLKKCFKDLDVSPLPYNEEVHISEDELVNDREEEREPRINSQENTEEEKEKPKSACISPRELKKIWESRVSNGRREAGEIRLENGGEDSRGFKPFQGNRSGENRFRNKAVRSRNYSQAELQSRLQNNAPVWESYLSGGQGKFERVRQVTPPEFTASLTKRETPISRYKGYPCFTSSGINDLLQMGGEARDALLFRGGT